MEEFLQVGKIVNTHGVRGELKIIPLTNDPGRFEELKDVFVGTDKPSKNMSIESVRYFKNTVIIKFKEIQDMNSAELLKNNYIFIDRKDAVKLPEDTYFICDLIGLEVFTDDGTSLGIVNDILQTGSNDVYIVNDENNKEILIPALKSVVKEISIEDKKMVVALPEGLLDLYL